MLCCGGDGWLLTSDKDRNQKLGLARRATRGLHTRQNSPMVLYQGIAQRTHTIMFRFGMFRFRFPEDE